MTPSQTPISVVGFQRSGTTLLQSLLGAHPRIAAPPEVHFGARILARRHRWGDLADDRDLRRVIRALLNPPLPIYADAGFDEERLFRRMAGRPRTYAALLDTMLSDFAERHGAARWSEKTPGQSPGLTLRLFPDVQLVHIVRRPTDVVASCLRTPWAGSNVWSLARQWKRFNLDAIAVGSRIGPGQYLRIRYEDLTRDPDAVLRTVFAYLREDHDPAIIDDLDARTATVADVVAPWQGAALRPVAPARRRSDELTRWQRARVNAVVHEVLAPLGYPDVSTTAVIAGHVLNVLRLPEALPEARWALRVRIAGRDPERLTSLVEEYVADQATRVRDARGRT